MPTRHPPSAICHLPFDLGRPETIAALQSFTNRRYTLLDPTLPDEGPYRARWRLRINLEPEELKATVWT